MEFVEKECELHGLYNHFQKHKNGPWWCHRCHINYSFTRRKSIKKELVEYAGGCCKICGYNKCHSAMQFHHIDPTEKKFEISKKIGCRSIESLKLEVDKCLLTCANCHAEIENGKLRLKMGLAEEVQDVNDFDLKFIKPERVRRKKTGRIPERICVCGQTKDRRYSICSCCKKEAKIKEVPTREFLVSCFESLKMNHTAVKEKLGISQEKLRRWCRHRDYKPVYAKNRRSL